MKLFKKTTALIMTIAICITVLAIPTFAYEALPTQWSNHIKNFPQVYKNIDRGTYGDYIKALQRYLMCFDYTCKNKLYYNGGYMDGDFGGRTESAVLYLQEQFGYTQSQIDGAVGPQTWGSIARSLRLYTENYRRIRRPQGVPGQWVFIIGASDGYDCLWYVSEDNTSATAI